ncbi:MAG TPA: hypothetical protein VI386_09140 [Candidatus Sulfotelmatobacter sp.]
MSKRIFATLPAVLLLAFGYLAGTRSTGVVHAKASDLPVPSAAVPRSYGKLVVAIPDSIGTGLVFEDAEGTIRFVSVNGMKEGELARYDKVRTHGGIPKSYGHLVSAVVNNGSTALIFEDANGVIRFVTVAGVTESELTRE